MSEIVVEGNVAYLAGAGASVYMSQDSAGFAVPRTKRSGTPAPVRKVINALDIAPWGEDNRFPQNIEKLLAFSGVAKETLNFKLKALWGNGIVYGKVKDYQEDGTEVFEIAKPGTYPEIDRFMRRAKIRRFYLEFLQDWVWFGNCFPEVIFDNQGKKAVDLIHQESCDIRLQNMDERGQIKYAFLSKIWGLANDQFSRFDPNRKISGLLENANALQEDNKFIKKIHCLDMYSPVENARELLDGALKERKFKSAILPVQYPSPNKTYYQLPAWDGARLSGWIEIAGKIPSMFKAMYNNQFNIKYHIEIPENYFERTYGVELWNAWDEPTKKLKKKEVLKKMDDVLSGSENAYKAFVSYYITDAVTGKEYGQIKITQIENKTNIDKDLMTGATANSEIMFAMGVNPDVVGAGIPGGAYGGNKGGSNIREGYLIYTSSLSLERQVILEPLYFVKDMNEWPEDLEFRIRDKQLTTLDKGTGSQKVIS